ncbi:winged helix-turn-helix domain-containing protein [Rathayibacter sp. KR2-224]|uniref:winged helix-turn-helix domain-containing protein n=1 Tax=Rathayibacter sp. KR2-224 TaxID=3400913 RepID=UPI003BFCEB59
MASSARLPTLSPALARRIALAAQGFGRPRPAVAGTRQLNGLIDRLGLLQIDSVNVFERSHYLPVFARLGSYDKSLLDALTMAPRASHTEYVAHEAAFVRREDRPLFRWRMDAMRARYGPGTDDWTHDRDRTARWLLAELAANGPMAASEIEHEENVRRGPWWGWSEVKRTLEMLFRFGDVAIAGRNRFERRYALPEQMFPSAVLESRLDEADAVLELVRRSVRALGIGTVGDIADYYRLKSVPTKAALRDLEDAGEVSRVAVAGWESAGRPAEAWLATDARKPREMQASALLSPFDPIVWERSRALRMFGLDYRIEIYTPAPKRVYGYYVLPVLQDDKIVARVDLKSDRKNGVLFVQSAWAEADADADTPLRLAALLREAAEWQGLSAVDVKEHGTLAGPLASAVAAL